MSLPRPAPSHHPDTLSSLTNENVGEYVRPSYLPFSSRQAWRNTTGGIQSRGMNRQSMLVFADFNNFESPRSSRQYPIRRGDGDDNNYDVGSGPDFDPDHKSTPVGEYSVEKNLPEPPYHIFTLARKKQMVYIVSLAGLFSPLSSNIYFPALGQISKVIVHPTSSVALADRIKDLKVSLSLVSLTITVYMVVQGLAPSFWGPLSDTKGRRITFIGQ